MVGTTREETRDKAFPVNVKPDQQLIDHKGSFIALRKIGVEGEWARDKTQSTVVPPT